MQEFYKLITSLNLDPIETSKSKNKIMFYGMTTFEMAR